MESNSSDSPSLIKKCIFLTYDPYKISQVKAAYIAAATINCCFILPTIILNTLLLCGMYRSPCLRKPSSLLLYSLSTSDLLNGLVVQPAYLVKKIGEFTDDFDMYCKTGLVTYTAGTLLSTVSFLNLTAIALDRFLIVTSGVHYPLRVTYSGVTRVVVFIWTAAVALIIVQFFLSRSAMFKVIVFIMVVSVVITTLCYVTAMWKIKKQRSAIQTISASVSIQRYRKTTITMMMVFLLFSACYIPYLATMVVAVIVGESADIWAAESIVSVILLANGSINPIVLFSRMKEVREAGKRSVNSLHWFTRHGKRIGVDVPLDVFSKMKTPSASNGQTTSRK